MAEKLGLVAIKCGFCWFFFTKPCSSKDICTKEEGESISQLFFRLTLSSRFAQNHQKMHTNSSEKRLDRSHDLIFHATSLEVFLQKKWGF